MPYGSLKPRVNLLGCGEAMTLDGAEEVSGKGITGDPREEVFIT